MEYDFRVGTYIETVDGEIGYVSKINEYKEDKYLCYEPYKSYTITRKDILVKFKDENKEKWYGGMYLDTLANEKFKQIGDCVLKDRLEKIKPLFTCKKVCDDNIVYKCNCNSQNKEKKIELIPYEIVEKCEMVYRNDKSTYDKIRAIEINEPIIKLDTINKINEIIEYINGNH